MDYFKALVFCDTPLGNNVHMSQSKAGKDLRFLYCCQSEGLGVSVMQKQGRIMPALLSQGSANTLKGILKYRPSVIFWIVNDGFCLESVSNDQSPIFVRDSSLLFC